MEPLRSLMVGIYGILEGSWGFLGPGHVADSSAAVCGRRHLGPSSAMLQKFGISVAVKGFRASRRLIRFGFVVQGFLVALVSVLQLQLVIRGFL